MMKGFACKHLLSKLPPSLQIFRPVVSRTPFISIQGALTMQPLQSVVHRRLFSVQQPRRPTKAEAASMPREYSEMTNEALLILSVSGDHDASRERLTREIMHVDDVTWENARPKLEEMEKVNKEWMVIGTLPYKLGLGSSLVIGVASIPLCFDLTTTKWFNEHFVTADVADDKDLETWLEVGSWSWQWMEPPLGQLSFFLLCLAFARNQLINLGWKPYTDKLRDYRVQRLQQKYPKYNPNIVQSFSVTDSWKS
jgi:hypothetical protein